MHGVYKYEYDGEVIYVGKTSRSFEYRFYQHACEEKFKPYLDKIVKYICVAEDEHEADFWETALISEYKPILNAAKKGITATGIHIDINWQLYRPNVRNKINTRQYGGRKTRKVNILTYPEIVDRIDAYTEKMNISRAELFEVAIEEYLSKHAE